MRAVALLLLLSLAASAEEPLRREAVEVKDGTVRTMTDEVVSVHGGAYLPLATLMSVGQEMAALRAENKALKEAPVATPKVVVIALVVGVGLGVGATLYLVRR